jgi:hypothetical protein
VPDAIRSIAWSSAFSCLRVIKGFTGMITSAHVPEDRRTRLRPLIIYFPSLASKDIRRPKGGKRLPTMPTFLEVIKTLGGIAGIVALVWRGWDEFGSHLRISIKVDGPQNGWVTALTTVDNKGNRAKDISYAFLLIGPESEHLRSLSAPRWVFGVPGFRPSRFPVGA